MNKANRSRRHCWSVVLGLGAIAAAVAPCHGDDSAATAPDRLFTLRVLPLLENKCFGCHGADADEVRGDLDLLTREGMLAGGASGEPALSPGAPEESPLYQAVLWEGYEMPPKESDRLTDAETETLREWIAAGAPWPDHDLRQRIRESEWTVESNDEGRLIATSGGTSDEWTYRRYRPEDLWAFDPVRAKEELLPGRATLTEAIDHFVDQRLAEAELTPAPQASPRDLIRRATFDLTGLPPEPEEIDAFEAAWSEDSETAWGRLVDRLLESPRYGEHWGRRWLDVTRYSDTGGMSNDYERSNMWRYRDYVIRAFNNDKPYDEFVVEQLAGDELADLSVAERTGGSAREVRMAQRAGDYTEQEAEWIVATGFLRLGPWDNAMIEADEARQIYLDDLVNITGQAFLAQTLRCCKCHDHKFDPIPTRDYYRVYAAFSTTQMAERPAPFLAVENRDRFATGEQHVRKMLDFATAQKEALVEKRETAARAWYEERGLEFQNHEERNEAPDEEKPPRDVGLDYVEQGRLKVREQDEWIWTRRLERYQPLAQSVYNAPTVSLAWNGARKLRINRSEPEAAAPTNHILLGGALTAPGGIVRPGVLSAVGAVVDADAEEKYLITDAVDGRRLALARWIAGEDNSLATRAIANRLWQGHFGVGLAGDANNFGAKGGSPSHPGLLDFLATDFVENGWRIKRMHRAIMMSHAYRRDSGAVDSAHVAKVDPDNRLLSHFPRRRLTAEEIRDAVLAVTGELRHGSGGAPIMPEINLEVALQPRMIQFSLAPAYQPSRTPDERNRRTIYAYHVRGQADPFTEVFNQPNPNESCQLRESAAATPQAFTLMNSDLMTDRSIALALRLQEERPSLDGRVERAFRLVLGRLPTNEESRRLAAYVDDMRRYHDGESPEAPAYPVEVTRSLVEELTGRPFEYREILPTFNDYVPDRKPADVSPETRALADLCIVLLNTNEFMYVD